MCSFSNPSPLNQNLSGAGSSSEQWVEQWGFEIRQIGMVVQVFKSL